MWNFRNDFKAPQNLWLSLRTLLTECEFPTDAADPTVVPVQALRELLIALQLARGTYNKTAQQKILQESKVDLARYIDIALAGETSSQDTSRLNATDAKVAKTTKSFDNGKTEIQKSNLQTVQRMRPIRPHSWSQELSRKRQILQ